MEVNYDTRVRMIEMEKSPHAAVKSFEEMDKKLAKAVSETELDQDVRLTALTPYHQEFGTTFGREVRRACLLMSMACLRVLLLH